MLYKHLVIRSLSTLVIQQDRPRNTLTPITLDTTRSASIMGKVPPSKHVENINVEGQDDELHVSQSKVNISGTVKLTAGKIVYIPTPTSDPRGLCWIQGSQ
jgi:hypothetical protein